MSGYVIDSSALLAVALGEADAASFVERLVEPVRKVVNAATLFEAAIAAERRAGIEGRERLDRLVERVGPEVVPFSQELLGWAREAFRRFGKGRHPAGLNLGDCIAYATARHEVLPLLFKGDDFPRTDIEPA
ncbi:MAG: type II toxin-antitoxin system VapC family toxin [Myxococcota bacterium]